MCSFFLKGRGIYTYQVLTGAEQVSCNFLLHINLGFYWYTKASYTREEGIQLLYFKWYLLWCKILGTSTTWHVVFENSRFSLHLVQVKAQRLREGNLNSSTVLQEYLSLHSWRWQRIKACGRKGRLMRTPKMLGRKSCPKHFSLSPRPLPIGKLEALSRHCIQVLLINQDVYWWQNWLTSAERSHGWLWAQQEGYPLGLWLLC